MDAGSVISFLIGELVSSNTPIGKNDFKVYVPDSTKKFQDKISAIEFIRENFDISSRGKRKRASEIQARETGIQMIEMVQGYMPFLQEAKYRPDSRNPYEKISLEDILQSDTIIPIFDIKRVFNKTDSVRVNNEKFAGYLRNVRDAYTARKSMGTFSEHKTVSSMYMNSMATFTATPDPIIPIPITKIPGKRDVGHIIFRDSDGNEYRRRKAPKDIVMVKEDESRDTNVLGVQHDVNCIEAGRRMDLDKSNVIYYDLVGLEFSDVKTDKEKTYILPKDNEKIIQDVYNKKVKRVLFDRTHHFAAEPSVRSLLVAGLQRLSDIFDNIKSWRDFISESEKQRRITGIISPDDLEKEISKVIKSQKIASAKLPKRKSEMEILNTSSLDAPIDDYIREVFFSIERYRAKEPDVADTELAELIRVSANYIDGKYYSRFTNNELEFFVPFEEEIDMSGMNFDEELALLTANFREEDYLGSHDPETFQEIIRKFSQITGSPQVIYEASDIPGIQRHEEAPKLKPQVVHRMKMFPESPGLRWTSGQIQRFPNRTTTDLDTLKTKPEDLRVSKYEDFGFDDATGLIDFSKNIHGDWKNLMGPNGENLEDERSLKTRIVSIITKYEKVSDINASELIEKVSRVPGMEIDMAIFKIGTFQNISDSSGSAYALARAMNETWRFCTALRQELDVISNFDFSNISDESDYFSTIPEMYQRSFYARRELSSIKFSDIFARIGLGEIPSIVSMSDAFPNDIYSINTDFATATKKSRGIALLYIEKMFTTIFTKVTSKMSVQAQKMVLGTLLRMFVNVLAEEVSLRRITDVNRETAKWVFQELWTESSFRHKDNVLIDELETEENDEYSFLDDSGVPRISEESLDDDEDIEEAEESWEMHDEISAEISSFISEWDDL